MGVVKDLIIAGIKEANIEEAKKHVGKRHYSPTDSAKCKRELFYEWRGFPKKPYTARELSIFAIGTMTHEYLQSIVKNQIAAEYRIDTTWQGLPFAGYVDSLIFDEKNKRVIVVDYKTISDRGMSYVNAKPKDDHLKQVNTYLALMGLKHGCLIYWNKTDGGITEHNFEKDEKIVEEVKNLFLGVQKCLDEDTLPDCTYDPDHNWRCKWCKFSNYCKKNAKTYDESKQAILKPSKQPSKQP